MAGRKIGKRWHGSLFIWVRQLNAIGRAMDERARTLAVTDTTREAITRADRAEWKRIAAAGPTL